MENILETTEKKELEVHQWQLLARDIQGTVSDAHSFQQHVHNWSKRLVGWELSPVNVSGTEWTAHAKREDPTMDVTELIRIFSYPVNGKHVLSYTYELTGSSPSVLQSLSLQELLQDRIVLFSLENATVLTQLTAFMYEDNHRTESLYDQAGQFVSSLGAVEIESFKEETFVSVSAYNDEWVDDIRTKDKKMNVQVALRQGMRLGSETTVTIGTPIITIEYYI